MLKDRRLGKPRLGIAAGLATAAALLGACGGTSSNGEAAKSPTQILADAKLATAAASSVHVAGTGVSNGNPIKLDLVAAHAQGGGSITASGATFQVVVAATKVYLKADAASWQKASGSAGAAQLLGNRWIQTTTTNQDFADVAKLTDVTQIVNGVTPTGTVTKQPVTKINGVSAIPLLDSGGKQGTLYVAATGKPVILRITNNQPGDAGAIIFDQYGTAKIPIAPAGAVNLDQLQQNATS